MNDRQATIGAVAALCAIILFDVWWRGHTFGPTVKSDWGISAWPVVKGQTEPLDCDEAAYAYIGRRLCDGATLYRDVSENKPPLGYWIYELAVWLGGATETTVRLLPIPLVALTIAAVWWIGLQLGGSWTAFFSALLYALVSTDPYLYANGAQLEHAINLFSALSLACFIRGWATPSSASLLACGAFAGAATAVRQVAAIQLAAYATSLLLQRQPKRIRAINIFLVVAGFGAVLALFALILVFEGAGRWAWDDVVVFGRALATDTPPPPNAPPFLVRCITGNSDPRNGALPWPFGQTDWLVWWGRGTWPLWLVFAVWLVKSGFRVRVRLGPLAAIVTAWTLAACVQVALPGLFWPHYYLLPMPGVCLVVSLLLVQSFANARSGFRAGLTARAVRECLVFLPVALAMVATGAIQIRDYLSVQPEQLTQYKGGRQWLAYRLLGRDLRQRSRAVWSKPRLFVWGSESPLHIYADLDSVSRHFFANNLMKARATDESCILVQRRIGELMNDLRSAKPELVFAGDPLFPDLAAFLNEGYVRSTLTPWGRHGEGLWVERSHYAEFERYAPTAAR